MTLDEMFEPSVIKPDADDERTCGTCLERKHVNHFYRDGKDRDGNYRYRRDCKECYRKTRLSERKAKRKPIPTTKPPRKGRSKK